MSTKFAKSIFSVVVAAMIAAIFTTLSLFLFGERAESMLGGPIIGSVWVWSRTKDFRAHKIFVAVSLVLGLVVHVALCFAAFALR